MDIREILENSKRAVVVSHMHPDGDAIGSSISLCNILNSYGIETTVILPNPPAQNLRVVEGVENIVYHFETPEISSAIIEQCDTIFCVDFNNIEERILSLKKPILANTTAKKVLIDHHQSPPENTFDYMFSDVAKSSTSLMIYEFAKDLGLTKYIDKNTAEAIYIGMMTDTGNFTFGNLTPELFRTLAELVELGVQPSVLYTRIFNTQSQSQVKICAYALYEKMYINLDLKCGYIVLTKEELERFNFKEGDLEGLVNIPLSIEGVLNSAIFTEKKDLVKISLRSLLDGIDVNKFARMYYIGGGHINAAGGKSYTTVEDAVDKYICGLKRIYNK